MGNILNSFRDWFFGIQNCHVIMVGLDAVGKTTILYQITQGQLVTSIPTIGFNLETTRINNVNLTIADVGGGDKIRVLWKQYVNTKKSTAVIFVVDSGDQERMEEAAYEFQRILGESEFQNVTFLILANKQDLPLAMTVEEISRILGFDKLNADPRPFHIQPCSALNGTGLEEGILWLTQNVSKGLKPN